MRNDRNDIHVPEEKFYTLSEVVDVVQQTLESISEHSEQNKLEYSAKDIYWLLHDMLRYVNRNVLGEFSLEQVRKDFYRVKYTAEDVARQRSNKKLQADITRTADYLEELTGKRPSWG